MTQTELAPPKRTAIRPATSAATGSRRAWRVAPATAIVIGIVCALASAQGGYFPTSWGWASTSLFLALGVWAISSGRSEVGRWDVAFAGALSLFVGWIGLSIAWSQVPASSVLELERALVPLSCVAAFLVLARRSDFEWLTTVFVLAISAIAVYALSTRLFPDRLGAFDPFAVYRLSDPIGYWNGLGIMCVVGLLGALAVVLGVPSRAACAACAASTVVLGTTLYFTYSRASWVALAVGLAAVVAVSPRRLPTLAATAVLAVPVGLGVLAASRSSALTHRESVLPEAVDEGRRLAVVVVVLALVAGGLILLLGLAERRVGPRPRLSRALGLTGWLAVALVIVAVLFRFGTPVDIAQRSWGAFETVPTQRVTNLNDRLFSFSGNGRADLWTAAWQIGENHPVGGTGAGTFERNWQARTDSTFKVRDAHGLYIETFAELGLIGLVVLVVALSVPVLAGVTARRTPAVPALFGAYVAFLVHAGVDWDWELTGVTATALLAGALLLLGARTRPSRTIATPWRAGVVALAVLASVSGAVGLIGNSAVAHGRSAINDGDPTRGVAEADRAHRLMPWSPDPWLIRGEAQLLAGDRQGAAESFREAIEVDASDWRGWHDLAVATEGNERRGALRRALSLYPNSSEIQRTIEALRSTGQG